MWEKLAKASGLRASADQIRETNPYSYLGYLKEAAGMFESLGKFESTALCYYDLGEYERAEAQMMQGMTFLAPDTLAIQKQSLENDCVAIIKGYDEFKEAQDDLKGQD
ncbi:hypothetical protein Tco_1108944 [Tanacetum coccineum]